MTGRHAVTRLALALGVLGAAVAGAEQADPPCIDGEMTATVTLRYDARTIGDVAGLFLQVAYPPGVSLPGKGTDDAVKRRVASLVDPKFRLVSVDEDSDADGREDRVRMLLVATTKDALPATPVARIRFDCEKQPVATAFACTTDQPADATGQLVREKEAKQVTCEVTFPSLPERQAAPH